MSGSSAFSAVSAEPLPGLCLCLGLPPSLLCRLWVDPLLLLSYSSASRLSFRRLVNISFQNSSLAICTNIDVCNRCLQPPLHPPAPLRPPDPLRPPASLRPPAPLHPPAPLRSPASWRPSTSLRLLALFSPLMLVCQSYKI